MCLPFRARSAKKGISLRAPTRHFLPGALGAVAAVALVALLPLFAEPKPRSFLIINARIADGTGAPLYNANVRVAFSHIVGIGELQPEKDEPIIDARGLVLAPGFIDTEMMAPYAKYREQMESQIPLAALPSRRRWPIS